MPSTTVFVNALTDGYDVYSQSGKSLSLTANNIKSCS